MQDRKLDDSSLNVGETKKTHSENGVDLTLIRWMLSMTPAERLMTLQNTIRSYHKMTECVRRDGTEILPILKPESPID